VLSLQTSCSAACSAAEKLEQRVARWLLMCSDRAGDRLPLVHERISLLLHVRRAGVTTAIHILEGQGAIRATRGEIVITDRKKLQQLAGWSYGIAEAEYEQLM